MCYHLRICLGFIYKTKISAGYFEFWGFRHPTPTRNTQHPLKNISRFDMKSKLSEAVLSNILQRDGMKRSFVVILLLLLLSPFFAEVSGLTISLEKFPEVPDGSRKLNFNSGYRYYSDEETEGTVPWPVLLLLDSLCVCCCDFSSLIVLFFLLLFNCLFFFLCYLCLIFVSFEWLYCPSINSVLCLLGCFFPSCPRGKVHSGNEHSALVVVRTPVKRPHPSGWCASG